ncbi:hypothetical protein VPH35_079393 [Triticum aestivum]
MVAKHLCVNWGGLVAEPGGGGVLLNVVCSLQVEESWVDMARYYYLIHATPRIIRISGVAMRQQLIGTQNLDHELASIIFRRYSQSDQEANSECPCLNWRHNMEPDFATFVLANHEYLNNISIQNQLGGKDFPYDIISSQMFFIPVPLEDGWVVLMWDMMSRKPHILDLMIRGDGPTEPTKDKLELIAWKLHHALFHCLNEYYAGWLAYARRRVGGPLRTCCNETFVRHLYKTPWNGGSIEGVSSERLGLGVALEALFRKASD